MSQSERKVACYATMPFEMRVFEPIRAALAHVLITQDIAEVEQWNPDVVVVATAHQIPRLREYCDSRNALLVALRHGAANKYTPPREEYALADYICGSDWDEQDFRAAGVVPRKGFLLTGNPWVDEVFTLPIRTPDKHNPTILFAPTWNPETSAAGFAEGRLIDLIRKVYPSSRIILRPHPNVFSTDHPLMEEHREIFERWVEEWRRQSDADAGVELIKDLETPITRFFPDADILISDASSLVFEFMALDRPILLYTSGRTAPGGDYARAIGNCWRDVGIEFNTEEEFTRALSDAFAAHSAVHSERQRRYTEELYGSYRDGRSVERVARAVESLPRLDVLVIARNAGDSIASLPDALRRHIANCSIHMVDNASADNTPTILQSLDVDSIKLCNEHLSLGKIINSFLSTSTAEHVMLVRYDPSRALRNAAFITRATDRMSDDRSVAAMGRVRPMSSCEHVIFPELTECLDADYCLLNRQRVLDAGGFPEDATDEMLDVELTARIVGAGLRIETAWDERPVVSFGEGFYREEQGIRWMSAEGSLTVGHSLSCGTDDTDITLALCLTCDDSSRYQHFPFTVEVFRRDEPIRTVHFTKSRETAFLCIPISTSTDEPCEIRLESEESFIPARLGYCPDTRRLSVLISRWEIILPGKTIERAREMYAFGDQKGAIDLLEALVSAQPEYAEAHNDLGVLYYQAGKTDKAISRLRHAISLDREGVDARKNLADIYLASGRIEEAACVYHSIWIMDPHDSETLLSLGRICETTGDIDGAEFFFNKLIDLETNNSVARLELSRLRAAAPVRHPIDYDPAKYETISCPLCGSDDALPYRRKHDVVRCAKCEAVYLRTRLTPEAMEEFYQWYGEDWNYVAVPRDEDALKNSPLRRAWFLKEIQSYPDLPGNRLLDVGCSWGAFLLNARENGFEPRGIEITRKSAEFAESKLGIHVTSDQLTDTPIEYESISVVTMIHSLEHLPNTREAISRVFDILEPGGMYCGLVPNIESVCSQVLGAEWPWLEPSCHYVHFSPESLSRHLRDAGFVVEKIYTRKGDYDRDELAKVIQNLHAPLGIELSESELDEIIRRAEENGFGEEIRFFARKPVLSLRTVKIGSGDEYREYLSRTKTEHDRRAHLESQLAAGEEPFTVPGFCYVCRRQVNLSVDYRHSRTVDGKPVPNWREHLICPECGFNNRTRASIQLFEQLLKPSPDSRIYISEQTTPLYKWLVQNYPNVVGSEFLGDTVPLGQTDSRGYRNESLTQLSFRDSEFDIILSFDVFEHIPDFERAFTECLRVLKPGGSLLFTIPFNPNLDTNSVLARLTESGEVEEVTRLEYHADPLDPKGCLSFYQFGWEVLDQLKSSGFTTAEAHIYWSKELGYLGGDQRVFVATRAGSPKQVSVELPGEDTDALRNQTVISGRESDAGFPRVSIIIPVHNDLSATRDCLKSLLVGSQYPNYEIIVVDRASTDGTREYLAGLERDNVRWLSLPEDIGPVKCCNLGAELATGEYIVLLNQHTLASGNWLSPLARMAARNTGCGAVTARIADTRSRIVEAGSSDIVDGAAVGYGEGSPMDHPAYCHAREIESGSRYCMLMKRAAWEGAGGLDEEFADPGLAMLDLGLSVRKMGMSITYQPLSVIRTAEHLRIDAHDAAELSPSEETLARLRPVITAPIPSTGNTRVGKVLVLGIYLADTLNNTDDIVREISESKRFETVQRWVALRGDAPTERVAHVTTGSISDMSPKYKILNDLLSEEDLSQYDYIISIDDDIVLPKGFMDGFIGLQAETGFAIAQPARSSDSYIDHPIVEQQRGVIARETLFVEIGPVVSFHKSAYDLIFPFDLTCSMGWGYENIWAHRISEHGLKMGIIDAVAVNHSLRPPAVKYNRDRVERELEALLSKHAHMPLEKCYQVLSVTCGTGGKK